VLRGIKVDPAPYAAAIKTQTQDDYNGWTGLGNLFLLSDNPADAKAAFEKAYALAPDNQLPPATESLARVIKAQDCTIGRANAFILSLRPPNAPLESPTTKPSGKPDKKAPAF
jgi:hypothetical protein